MQRLTNRRIRILVLGVAFGGLVAAASLSAPSSSIEATSITYMGAVIAFALTQK